MTVGARRRWRPSPPLAVGAVLAATLATLIATHEEPPAVVHLPVGPEPLVALPWDRVGLQRVGAVAVDRPLAWADAGPRLRALELGRRPERSLRARLDRHCADPVVLRWRDQWRGECLTARGTRIRGAAIWVEAGWRGVEVRYSDRQDARLAPRVARMLASLRPAA